jgi:glycosyltransferase involved in cell wall biosynthesis
MENPKMIDSMITDYERMDAIICVAESAKSSFITRYPQLADKTYVIYNFFDVETIKEQSKAPFQYKLTEQGYTILLSVGRLTPQKKYMRFLRVLARLKNEGYLFHWYVLGEGGDREEMEDTIARLDLKDCVFLEGLTDNPYRYMANCDLFILPSGWEGFPTVTVEAKLLGCPVLATDVSGIREQLVHGKTSWIVENSEGGIYQGLKYLLDHPEIRELLRNNLGMDAIINNDEKYNKLMAVIGGYQ